MLGVDLNLEAVKECRILIYYSAYITSYLKAAGMLGKIERGAISPRHGEVELIRA